jgi:hypothetical protein
VGAVVATITQFDQDGRSTDTWQPTFKTADGSVYNLNANTGDPSSPWF